MRGRLLAARRAQLLVRSERLRREIVGDASLIALRLHRIDRIIEIGRRGGPLRLLLAGGVAALLLAGRTRRLLGLLSWVGVLYPVARRTARLFSSRP
jgi:hypothetical protein